MELRDLTEPELSDLLDDAANAVLATARRRSVRSPLFALILFDEPGVGQYVSNAVRADVVKALRECADRLDSREDVPRGPADG